MSPRPQLLPSNQVDHFYRGGSRIAALRRNAVGGDAGGSDAGGTDPGGTDAGGTDAGGYDAREPTRPEEWLASTTAMAADPRRGLTVLPDGALLRDAVLSDPHGWLGSEHVDAYGASTELLVKLLDAGQRLPVHLHPDRAFARQHLGVPHGKTEAWVVLEAADGACVRLGFAQSMGISEVRAMVDGQDVDGLVSSLRPLPARPGDAVLVPAGLPHCIDAGIFVVELQEPTDLSILLEWSGFAVDGRQRGHLGLGFDTALQALRLDALGDDELEELVRPGEQAADAGIASLLPAAADPWFRAHRLRSGECDAGFAVVVLLHGAGRMLTGSGDRLDLRRGDVAVVPWAAGPWRVDSDSRLDAIVCRPPHSRVAARGSRRLEDSQRPAARP